VDRALITAGYTGVFVDGADGTVGQRIRGGVSPGAAALRARLAAGDVHTKSIKRDSAVQLGRWARFKAYLARVWHVARCHPITCEECGER